MAETKPLLKGFGAAANVVGQIATDKAVNSRRTRSDFLQFNIADGQLLENVTPNPTTGAVPHGLRRIPKGAFILSSPAPAACTGLTQSTVIINPTAGPVTLWIV